MKKLQEHHLYTRELHDIGYNFLIDADGKIYEGLGWKQNCIEYKFDGFCFAFIGTFNKVPPHSKTIEALKKLIEFGCRYKFLNVDEYKLHMHPRLQQNSKLYENIEKLYNISNESDYKTENVYREDQCASPPVLM